MRFYLSISEYERSDYWEFFIWPKSPITLLWCLEAMGQNVHRLSGIDDIDIARAAVSGLSG